MDIGTTTVDDGATPTADGPGAALGGLFGTRPQTGRPHSINLFGAAPTSDGGGLTRGLDVLVGLGLGAVAMYYLDPDNGARRRSVARDGLVAAAGLVASALVVRGVSNVGPAEPA